MSRRNRRWRKHIPMFPVGTATAKKYILPPYPMSYGTANLGHVVLMGDSIIDNEHYTNGAPDVSQRLFGILGDNWKVSLLARDGATTRSFEWQVSHIPADATHIVLSLGGNDALGKSGILRDQREMTIREVLEELALMREYFKYYYEDAVLPLLELGVPITVCTIYNCDFPVDARDATLTALALFNDVVLQFAFAHELDVLDLRHVCTSPEDYELQIEPSAVGGAKIARAISDKVWEEVPV